MDQWLPVDTGRGVGKTKGFTKEYTDTCSDAYVDHLDFSDCFMGIYICQITDCTLEINVMYINYTSIEL